MGHFYPKNLDILFLNLIHKKGSASINDAVELALKRGESFHAAEGNYEQKYMLQMGFEAITNVHLYNKHIAPIFSVRGQKAAYKRWQKDEFDGDLATVVAIQFTFTKGNKSKFRTFVIDHIES